jgi:tetratricopeptide (TPR) repeat protein
VRATIAGKPYWLDGTRTGDTSLDRLAIPAFGWGLPLVPTGAALVRMMPVPLEKPGQDIAIHIDASAGVSVPAPITVETILRGDEAIGTNAVLVNLAGDARDRALKVYWRNQFDFVEVKTAGAGFDPHTGELRLTMAGAATMNWDSGFYYTDKTGVGYKANFSRTAGPDDAVPFAVAYPYFNRTRETIVLPKEAGTFTIGAGADVDETVAGIQYRRHAAITGNVFTVEKTERSLVPEFPAGEAPAAQKALRALAEQYATLHKPANYALTAQEVAALRAETPTTAAGYAARANALAATLPKEALVDFAKAIELAPDDAGNWMARGGARVDTGDLTGAKADFEKAKALDPKESGAAMGLGMVAITEGRFKDAVADLTEHLERDPKNAYVLSMRSLAYMKLSDLDHAIPDLNAIIDIHKTNDRFLSDAYMNRGYIYYYRDNLGKAIENLDKSIAISPDNLPALRLRAEVRIKKQDFAAANEDIEALAKADPKNREVFHLRGMLAEDTGDSEAAIAAFTAVLESAPDDAKALGARAEVNRSAGHLDAALRDAAAALKLQPGLLNLYLLRANILRNQGKGDEALAEAAAVQAAAPDQTYAYVVAAAIYHAYKKEAEAVKAFDRALAIKPEAFIYLNRARSRPKTDVAARLADLDTAIKLDPDSSDAWTVKARVEADSGDFTAAVASASAALAVEPDPTLLVLRGTLYARSGDMARADKDFAAARAQMARAPDLNNACWTKATAGVALASALEDCDKALEKAPDCLKCRDSRAFVLLRLGRLDDAIADYDRTLAKRPHQAVSLYGRAIAWARKGESGKAKADAAAALKDDPDIADTFTGYGLTLGSAG